MLQRASRVPPQSLESEQAVLGSMLIEAKAIGIACEMLTADDFYREAHQVLFVAASDLHERHEPVDLTTLAAELENRGQLEQAGGRPYLAALFDAVATAGHVEHYAKIVRDRGTLRRLITVGSQIVEECFGDVESVEDVLERAEQAVLGVRGTISAGEFTRLRDMMRATYERLGERTSQEQAEVAGIPSGLTELDALTQGWRNGNLVYIGGRPGQGKTTLMDTCALHAARNGYTVAQFSFEESEEEKAERYLAQGAGINSVRIRTGRLEEEHWRRVSESTARMDDYPLWCWAGSALTPSQLLSKARRFKQRQGGLDLVTVDYLQLMHLGRRTDGRTQEMDEISRSLKRLATELDAAVLVGSQLSREVEKRKVPRPVLADLRESGSIEADANLVVLLYNPDYYKRLAEDQRETVAGWRNPSMFAGDEPDPDDPSHWRDSVEVIVAKQRGGPTGTACAAFCRNTVEFRDLNEPYM